MILADSQQARLFHRRTATIYAHQRRRARDDHQEVGYTLEALQQLVKLCDRCIYCTCPLAPATFQLDHAQPLSRGGQHQLYNLVCCCALCNQHKGKLTAREFDALLNLLRAWHPAAMQDVLRRLRAGGKYTRRHL